MSVRYPLDPFALPDRPDIHIPPVARRSRTLAGSAFRLIAAIAAIATATVVSAAVLFVPVFLSKIAAVQAVTVGGEAVAITAFAAELADLFAGTSVLALAIVSFVAGVLSSRSRQLRPRRLAGFGPTGAPVGREAAFYGDNKGLRHV